MPIEFQCKACSRTLRVPDGTAGKSCSCPGCQTRLVIPSPSIEQASDESLSVRIDVPCPNCGKTLECDARLDGTRGCCPCCSYIFTIRLDQDPNEVIAEIHTFPFACPNCKQLFEGTPEKLGRKGKCTNCSEVFVIERYQPPKPELRSPIPSTTHSGPTTLRESDSSAAKVGSTETKMKAVVPSKATVEAKKAFLTPPSVESEDPFASLSHDIPPPDITFQPQEYQPTVPRAVVRNSPSIDRRSRSSTGSPIKTILIVIGCLSGLGVFVLCAGLVSLGLWVQSPKKLIAGRYSVLAPGMKSKSKVPDEASAAETSFSTKTRSEFAIIQFKSDGKIPTRAEEYVRGLTMVGAVRPGSTIAISRAGLNGIHYESTRTSEFPSLIGEVFDAPDGLLMLMYVTAEELGTSGPVIKYMSKEKIRAHDNPDAFFESLSKND